jgi:hypothetical protein
MKAIMIVVSAIFARYCEVDERDVPSVPLDRREAARLLACVLVRGFRVLWLCASRCCKSARSLSTAGLPSSCRRRGVVGTNFAGSQLRK